MSRKRGFTLVELLVVIGIIALLLSVLIPALSKAREQAQRTVCLSNVRELGNAMRLYAAQFDDACPIGYMDQHQFSYVVNWNNANGTRVTMLGLLALPKLVTNYKTYFCPSVPSDGWYDFFNYNTPVNRFPNFQDWPNDPLFTQTGLGHTRISYNMRPVANWPTTSEGDLPFLTQDWTNNSAPRGFPRFSKLKNNAILSDMIISPKDVDNTHKTGINVLYANGSAQWVARSAITPKDVDSITRLWNSIALGDVNTAHNDKFLRAPRIASNGQPFPGAAGQWGGVWVYLDRAAGSSVR